MKTYLIAIIVLVVLGAGYYLYKSSNAGLNYGQPTNSSSPVVSSTGNSDAQLDSDLNSINSQMKSVDTEQTGIDSGLNQTAPNVQ